MINKEIPESLLQAIEYNPDTGAFTWLTHIGRCAHGSRAGFIDDRGYMRLSYKRSTFRLHRLAARIMTGRCHEVVDHVNGDKSDNRWANLRPATQQINSLNRTKPNRCRKTCASLGVTKHRGRYIAQFGENGSVTKIGQFRTEAEASVAYNAYRDAKINKLILEYQCRTHTTG